MAIERWTDDLSVGDARIDAQHRSIFERAGALEAELATGHPDNPRRALAFLRRYAMQHFSAEEALLERAGYPELGPHREVHQALTAQVVEAEARFQGGDARAADAVLVVLARILAHIRQEDAKFCDCLRPRPQPKATDSHPMGRSLLAVEEDHHRLFQYLHELGEAVRHGLGEAALDDLLPRLETFCRDHFRREELLMELTGYPGVEGHLAGHRELRDGLQALGERHRKGLETAAGVLDLLDQWSLKHLTGEDFLLASYLWSRP